MCKRGGTWDSHQILLLTKLDGIWFNSYMSVKCQCFNTHPVKNHKYTFPCNDTTATITLKKTRLCDKCGDVLLTADQCDEIDKMCAEIRKQAKKEKKR